jgi:hypothetical protein
MILVIAARGIASPVGIVLGTVDLDVRIRRDLAVEPPGTRNIGLRFPGDVRVHGPESTKRLPVGIVECTHQVAPFLCVRRCARKHGIHPLLRPVLVSRDRGTAGDCDVARLSPEDEHQGLVQRDSPGPGVDFPPWRVGPVDGDLMRSGKSGAPVIRAAKAACSARHNYVEPRTPRHAQVIGLHRSDSGQPAAHPHSPDGHVARIWQSVPTVPHAENLPVGEGAPDAGVCVAVSKKIGATLESTADFEQAGNREHGSTLPASPRAATHPRAICGVLSVRPAVQDPYQPNLKEIDGRRPELAGSGITQRRMSFVFGPREVSLG